MKKRLVLILLFICMGLPISLMVAIDAANADTSSNAAIQADAETSGESATFSDAITVYINGEKLDTSTHPQIIESRTFVPIRVIAEQWGAVVGWNQERQQVRITKDRKRIDLYIDEREAIVDGVALESDAPPIVLEGRTLIPLRFVGELLGAHVSYDAGTRTVNVILSAAGAPKDDNDMMEPEADLAILESIRFERDTIVVDTSKPVQPTVFYLRNPERIVMDIPHTQPGPDLPNATFDPETHQNRIAVDSTLVGAIRYANHNPEEHIVRIVVDLITKADYEVDLQEEDSRFSLSMAPGKYKVVIDAGHGAHDPGASYFGRVEKDFNLEMALRVQNMLAEIPRVEPMLTRTSDVFLELEERVEFAESHHADAFISIHANAFPQRSSVRGTETYYTHEYEQAFARIMHEHTLQATAFPDRGLHQNRFYVTRNTSMPAALIEVGFMSNPEDFSQLFQEEFQERVATAIVQGLLTYFEL